MNELDQLMGNVLGIADRSQGQFPSGVASGSGSRVAADDLLGLHFKPSRFHERRPDDPDPTSKVIDHPFRVFASGTAWMVCVTQGNWNSKDTRAQSTVDSGKGFLTITAQQQTAGTHKVWVRFPHPPPIAFPTLGVYCGIPGYPGYPDQAPEIVKTTIAYVTFDEDGNVTDIDQRILSDIGSNVELYPFKVTAYRGGGNDLKGLWVQSGSWTRNDITVGIGQGYHFYDEEFSDMGAGLFLGGNWGFGEWAVGANFLYARLNPATVENRQLRPATISLGAFQTAIPNTPDEKFDTYRLIATVQLNSSKEVIQIEQYQVGDIDDSVAMPDSESCNKSTIHGYRQTLAIRDDPMYDTYQLGTTELHNVRQHPRDGTAKSLPYIVLDENASGEMKWAWVDSTKKTSPPCKSLELISASAGEEYLALYGFVHASPSPSIPATQDEVLMWKYDAATPELEYVTKANFADWIEGELQIDWSQVDVDSWDWDDFPDLEHYKLSVLEGNDDHTQYILRIPQHSNGGRENDPTAVRNACPSIMQLGDANGIVTIYPHGRTLHSTDTAIIDGNRVSVDWESRILHHSNGIESVHWENQTLRGSGTGESWLRLDWKNRKLYGVQSPAPTPWTMEGANFAVEASYKYQHGSQEGITKDVAWDDANGQHHVLKFAGGICVGHTVTT